MNETETKTDETWVPTGADYASDRKFTDFPLSPEILKGIADLGYVNATPVQANTIEPGLAGVDMLVRAKTGTGKTIAFCVPVVERLQDGGRKARAMILAPTRELAQQIGDEVVALTKYRDLSVAVLVGGLPMGPQEQALAAGAEIIVGTPGRIIDHSRRKNLDLSTVDIVVLDEADEMLSMGFYEDVTGLLDATAKERQILLFSATISDETQRLVRQYLKPDYEDIRLSTDADQVENIEHIIYETSPAMHKVRALLYLLDVEDPTSAIIFCNTREDTATVASFLDRQGLDVQLLSGELSQARRSAVMQKVKSGEVRFLVSTDVASRGIDISDLSHVVNYALPQDPSVYLHRTGRTGRIGKKGTAISLVGGQDMGTKRVLETQHKLKFDIRQLPDPETCVQKRVERQARQIRDAMSSLVFESYLPTVRALKEREDGEALLAAALRAFFQWNRARRADASDLDSISALIEERNEKADRKQAKKAAGRDRDRGDRGERRDRGDRDRGERRDRDDRREVRGPRPAASDLDLDALLVAGPGASTKVAEASEDLEAVELVADGSAAPDSVAPADGESRDKKKRRRKRKRKSKAAGEAGSAAAGDEDAPESDGPEEAEGEAFDDLDDLLSPG